MRKSIPITLLLISTWIIGCSKLSDESGIFDRLSYYQPEGYKDSLLIGTLEVFENHDDRKGRKIPLHIIVTPALVRDSLKEPIFIIDGGPGIGVSHQSYFYTEIDTIYRRYHDIVFVDVRGTGKSQPLHCFELQTKASPQEHFNNPYPMEELKACIEMYQDSVDFNFYKTAYIVEDLEEVRKWLGYNKINLLGISFGGKVSLMFMDKYPNSINRAVLHAPDAPGLDTISHRGRFAQNALDVLFNYCFMDSLCNSSFPDIKQEFQILMKRIKEEQVRVDIKTTDTVYNIELSWPPIASKIAELLYEDASYIQIPYIIHEAYLENYNPLFDAFDIYNTETNYFLAYGMFLSNICAEKIPGAIENYDIEEKDSFLGDYKFQTRKAACASWPVKSVDESMHKNVISDIPTLIISGQLDPVLPPETGARISKHLVNSQHIVIPYMGHMFSELSNLDCYDTYVVSFFEGQEGSLDKNCFDEMKPNPFKPPSTKVIFDKGTK
jgi:pimeloyl-ACP methyl ester carboxylesterase